MFGILSRVPNLVHMLLKFHITPTHTKNALAFYPLVFGSSFFRLKGMLMLLCRITEMQHIFSIKKFVWAHEICVARQFYRKVHIYSKQHHLHAAQKKHQHQGKIRACWSVGDCIVLLWCWKGKRKTLKFGKKRHNWSKQFVRMQFVSQCTRILVAEEKRHSTHSVIAHEHENERGGKRERREVRERMRERVECINGSLCLGGENSSCNYQLL